MATPRRPNFPYSTTRHEPALDLVAQSPPTKEFRSHPDLVKTIIRLLKDVRAGSTTDKFIGALQVIRGVTQENGTTFIHLTDEARTHLIDGRALPWGE